MKVVGFKSPKNSTTIQYVNKNEMLYEYMFSTLEKQDPPINTQKS